MVALAACAPGVTSVPATAAPAVTLPPALTAAATTAASTLPDLAGKSITVAVEDAYIPFNYVRLDNGKAEGWDYDAIAEICKRVNCKPVFKEIAWDPMITAVSQGQFDIAADGITITPERASFTADFDGNVQTFERGECNDLALAYCCSIHKSQGSEYAVVIVPLLKAHFMMLQRNLIYTAITRGRKKVFLVGEPAAYAMAVRNSESKQRITHLREKIAAAP